MESATDLSVKIASIFLETNIQQALDYFVPEAWSENLSIGCLVEVPLRAKTQKGIIISFRQGTSSEKLKSIQQVLSFEPLIKEDLLQLAMWMANYYCTPLSKLIKIFLPSAVRGQAQFKEQYFITRLKTRDEIIELLPVIRKRSSQQAEILDALLLIKKGILMTELLEKTKSSSAALGTLIKKEILAKEKVIIDRSNLIDEEYFPSQPKILSDEQAVALDQIKHNLNHCHYATHLLFGVTGSGKTEIYLQAIQQCLDLDKGSIMLVPEIALTEQTIERFKSRFQNKIAVLHHRLSQGERHDAWKNIQEGKARIVIGARSAIFSPVHNLGLIIIDEEHDHSYKNSDSMPTYHARDVAVMRAHLNKAVAILGSATPSLESYANALAGKYILNTLKKRPNHYQLPNVRIVDMRQEYEKKKGFTIFSDDLLSSIEKKYQKGEQTLLFLNRRGYHTLLLCKSCGQSAKCPSCEISLTFHKNDNTLACHLCEYTLSPPPKQCLSCRSEDPLKFKGIGTEQVESALYAIFPEIRVMRLDADTTKHKGSHQKLYKAFRTGKADVLIGTQMIAKGLHFPEVSLVGVLNCDSNLHIPDFRASETTFQLLTQVAGRAGRSSIPGDVIFQTAIPDHPVIQKASQQDFEAFYKEEIESRKMFHYPPFTHLIKMRFSGPDKQQLENYGNALHEFLLKYFPEPFIVSSVHPCGYFKIKDQYRYQIIINGPRLKSLNNILSAIHTKSSIKLLIDIQPMTTFF